jgi:rare lipoprotein A
MIKAVFIYIISTLIIGCSTVRDSGPPIPIDFTHAPDAVPKNEPRSRYGNPASYTVNGRTYYVMASSSGYIERGNASWYGRKFHGRLTSSREPYNMYAMTAAHRSLPLPTWVRVTNLDNGRSVVVKVNDRGPFADGRIIDLSYAAASKIGMVDKGVARVEVRAIDHDRPTVAQRSPAVVATSAAAAGKIFVQAGSFVNRVNAEQLRQQLQSHQILPLSIQQGVVNSQPIYRVRVGPLASSNVAEGIIRQIGSIGVEGAKIVVD